MIQQTIIEGLWKVEKEEKDWLWASGIEVHLSEFPGFSCYSLYIPEWGWRALQFWTANRNRWEKEGEKEKRDRDIVGETEEWRVGEREEGSVCFPFRKGEAQLGLSSGPVCPQSIACRALLSQSVLHLTPASSGGPTWAIAALSAELGQANPCPAPNL